MRTAEAATSEGGRIGAWQGIAAQMILLDRAGVLQDGADGWCNPCHRQSLDQNDSYPALLPKLRDEGSVAACPKSVHVAILPKS